MIDLMERRVVHLSETEAIHDFASVLRLIDSGSEVVGEFPRPEWNYPAESRHGRPLSECLRLAEGPAVTLDPAFSAELEDLIRSHQPLSSEWE